MICKWVAVLSLCALPYTASAQTNATSVAEPAATTGSTPETPASSTVNEQTSFGSLFTQLPHAFAGLGRREPLLLLAAGGGAAAILSIKDTEMTAYAVRHTQLVHNLAAGQVIGDGYVQGGIALGTYLAGRMAQSHEVTLLGAHLVRAQLVSGIITDVTKVVVRRQRPNGGKYSFPSGHTTSAFATAEVLQDHYGWKVGIPAYAVGTYVGLSRMADNRHYPSDLVVGAMVGVVSARSVTLEYRHHRFAAAPLVAPGGVGIALTRVN